VRWRGTRAHAGLLCWAASEAQRLTCLSAQFAADSSPLAAQTALILSIPRRRPGDETQETLRTSAFPSTHIKEKWAKNLYIGGITYGRTVS
jgi:hypothetical protein